MNRPIITFVMFIIVQLLFWLVGLEGDYESAAEIISITLFIGLFLLLFFRGFRWARWVAIVLLALLSLLFIAATLEGGGFVFSAIALLYVLIIVMLFRHKPPVVEKIADESPLPEAKALTPPAPEPPPIPDGFYADNVAYRYPLLLKRYQSLFIDFLLLFSIMIITMVLIGDSEIRQTVMVSMGVLFLLVYEPLLTVYSATIGQRMMGIRVRDVNNPANRIGILRAYIRLVVKWYLGWLSFITINFNPQHRAIHDMASASVVIKID